MSDNSKVLCENCGIDITAAGSQICDVCDPDVSEIIDKGERCKTPCLCIACFDEHRFKVHGLEPGH